MIGTLFTLFAAAAAFPGAARDAAPSACKLTPFDADWPSHAEWTALNKSIGGALIETRPSASSCYLGNPFDSSLNCKTVESNWTQAAFHADLPESIGSPVYANNSCLPPGATGYTNSSGCHLGGYPSYVVNATSDKQIAEAARWASKRNIRIVVKGTGHDLAGRSSGAYALSIWTRYLKNVSFQSNWKVPGSHNETDTVLVAASGLNYGDAVRHALKYDHVVVSGNDATVGLGGHIQGGGHGPLSSTFGLASDNVYQVRAVTTQGDIITADATQNQDLWWALKGGGAGQYAIVTEYVLKAHPAPSVVQMGFSISSKGNSLAANESTWKALSSFLRQVPDLMDAGLAGAMVIQGHHDGAVSVNQGFYAFGKSKAEAERLNNQIISRIRSAAGGNSSVLSVTASETSDPIPYKTFFEALNAAGSNQAGAVSVPTSHLLGRPELSEIDDDTLISYLRRAITNSVPSNSGYGVFGLQGGPGPAKTPENMRGALLPAWRHTYLHAMSYSTTVDTSLKPSELFRQVSEDINENKETLWKEWAPNTGAYMNEANPFDPDFKNNFYGSSYDRLVEIKKKYDPTESLWVLSGVGSDEWDYDLDTGKLCKI